MFSGRLGMAIKSFYGRSVMEKEEV